MTMQHVSQGQKAPRFDHESRETCTNTRMGILCLLNCRGPVRHAMSTTINISRTKYTARHVYYIHVIARSAHDVIQVQKHPIKYPGQNQVSSPMLFNDTSGLYMQTDLYVATLQPSHEGRHGFIRGRQCQGRFESKNGSILPRSYGIFGPCMVPNP